MPVSTKLAVRSSTGVEIWSACGAKDPTSLNKEPYKPFDQFQRDETKMARCFCFSPCGKYFAWTNGRSVNICTTNNWKIIHELARPRAFYLKFSPKGTYLMTWEQFVINKETQEGAPNLFIYKAETGEDVFNIIQKRQTDWEPNWSSDEVLVALMIGGEVLFYEPNSADGFTKFVRKLGGKNGSVSMSPVNYPPHIAFYVPGVKAAPSMCRLFKYPNLETNQPVATKSFFQADRIEMMWNKKGSGLLILTSTEVDQTGASYYGKQALHFIATKGDSCAVSLNADGPIHAVAWSPKSNEFCVVYGYIPSKATLFNLKCDPVFDFGTGVRNSIHFNNFGNLVLFGGFGNLRGNIEVWDVKQRKEVSKSQAQDTTLLDWAPTGDVYFTATCAPRLRMSNGFKIWHYSGALLSETHWPEKQELLELSWQTFADGSIPENVISYDCKIEGIQSSQPTASVAKYVPPNIRNLPPGVEPSAPIIPGLPPDYRSSKYDSRNKRNNNRRNNNNKPRPGNGEEGGGQEMNEDGTKKPRKRAPKKPREPRENNGLNVDQPAEGGDTEKSAKPERRQQQQRPRKSESAQNPDANGETEAGDTEKVDKPPRRPQKKREARISTGDHSDKSKTPPTNQNQDNDGTATPKPSRRERRAAGIERARKSESQDNNEGENQQKTDKPRPQKPRHNSTNDNQEQSDPDKDMKKKINRKLKDIKVLKEKLEKGEKLDANQMTKINAESSLIQQLKSLKVS